MLNSKQLKGLKTLIGGIASMLLITVGGMLPSSIFFLNDNLNLKIFELPTSWQVPALLLSGSIFGPESGLIGVLAYITLGILYLPVFSGGGSVGYIATPEFGYIAGFIPAIWVTGIMISKKYKNSLYQIFIALLAGLTIIHLIGIINILIGTLTNRWQLGVLELLITYSISTFPFQLLLCPSIVLLTKATKKILI